jgi:N-methylhydantoinase B
MTESTTAAAPSMRDLDRNQFEDRYSTDRFTASVLASRFRYIVKHMCTHLMTNAFSPILRDWYDFSATLSGPPDLGYPMSAVSDSLMVFSGCMSEAVRNSVTEFGPENLMPGDILICNDPMRTGTHVNDMCFIRPIFGQDRILGFVNIEPHMMDMGGTVPAGFSAAKETTYENGLVIPPMLLYREEKPLRSAFSLIFDNARFGEIMLPDMQSIVADLRLGERLVLESVERYGVEAYLGAIRYATDVTAEAMRYALLEMPDGVYEGEDMIDCDAIDATEEYTVHAKVKVAGSRVEVDLSGSSRQARTCINCGWLDVKTSVAVALKFLLEPTSPFTSGAYRHLDIVLPDGSFVSALPPEGTIMLYWEASSAVLNAVFRALADALGPRAVAGDFASAMTHNANGRLESGQQWASSATCGGELGPWGASSSGDGENSLAIYLANSIAPAIEAIEASAPVVVLRREIATDTSGAGRNRGGAAIAKDSLWLTPSDQYVYGVHLKRASGFGVHGGSGGSAGGVWMWPGETIQKPAFLGYDSETFAKATPICGVLNADTHMLDHENGRYFHFGRKPVWKSEPNTVVRYQTNAGGGWGDPFTREPERVLRDVRNEYVSQESARELYGVVIDGDPDRDPEGLRIDEQKTAALRGRTEA